MATALIVHSEGRWFEFLPELPQSPYMGTQLLVQVERGVGGGGRVEEAVRPDTDLACRQV